MRATRARRRRTSRRDILHYAIVGSFVLFVGGVFVLYVALDTSSSTVVSGAKVTGAAAGSVVAFPDAGALSSAVSNAKAMHKSMALFVVRSHREVARMVRTGGRRGGAMHVHDDDANNVATARVMGEPGGGGAVVAGVTSSSTPTGPGAPSASSWDVSEHGGHDGDDGARRDVFFGASSGQGPGGDPAALLLGEASTFSKSIDDGVAERWRLLSTLLPKPQILYLFGVPRSKHDALPMPGALPPSVPPLPHRADPSYLNRPPVVVKPQGDLERKPGGKRGTDGGGGGHAASSSKIGQGAAGGAGVTRGGDGGGGGEGRKRNSGGGDGGGGGAGGLEARINAMREREVLAGGGGGGKGGAGAVSGAETGAAAGAGVVGDDSAAKPVKPSTAERAIAKAESFHLAAAKVDELLAKRQDIALGLEALAAARSSSTAGVGAGAGESKSGRISCGGKPIMEFREMAAAAGVPGIDEVLPASDDLVTVGGDVGTARGGGGGDGGEAEAGGGARNKPSLGRCAVVGNSGALLDSQRGAEIDAHDAVIRFNAAPTRRFEKYVGTKTTVRMQNVDNLGWHEPQDKALIFTGRSENDFRKYVAHRRRKPNASQRIFHPEFWCHVWDWVERRKTKPSTGLAGVILALRSCDHPVSVYGFSHNSSKFHYFNHLPEKVTTQEVYWYHPLAEEHKLYKDLDGMGRLKMVS